MCDSEILKEKIPQSNAETLKKTTPCYLLTIAKKGVEVFRVSKEASSESDDVGTCSAKEMDQNTHEYLHAVAKWEYTGSDIAEVSSAANWLAIGSQDGLKLIDIQNNMTEKYTIPITECKRVIFSPKGTYLGTLIRKNPGSSEPNFKLWDVEVEKVLSAFDVPGAPERWPSVTWSQKESFFFRIMPKEILVYTNITTDVAQTLTKIPLDNVQTLAVSAESSSRTVNVALFCPALRQKLPHISIWSVSLTSEPKLITSESLEHVQEVFFYWNNSGTALLVLGQSDVDRSGRSYYGTSNLTFFPINSKGNKVKIIDDDEGPVSACQWCPSTNEFVVISGPIHSTKLVLYDGTTGNPKLSFGSRRRNIIRFNSFGRFLCFAGFGNLPGEVDIWDKNKKILIGQTKLPVTVEFEWAPDGRMLLAATTTPRMRVDNGVKIIRYNGELLDHIQIPDLYGAKWIPATPGTHVNRAASPERSFENKGGVNQINAGGDCENEAYRPRGPLQGSMRIANGNTIYKTETLRIATVIPKTSQLPPGAQFVDAVQSKSARRNALRRKKNKEARNSKENQAKV